MSRARVSCSPLLILVVTAPPGTLLIPASRSAVEPLVHAPKAVQSAGIGGIGVVDDAVVGHERAHPWPFAGVGARIRSAGSGELNNGRRGRRSGIRSRLHRATLALGTHEINLIPDLSTVGVTSEARFRWMLISLPAALNFLTSESTPSLSPPSRRSTANIRKRCFSQITSNLNLRTSLILRTAAFNQDLAVN